MKIKYAIGDVHGKLELLKSLLTKIDLHAQGREYELVFLGDLVDRGEDSKGVVQLVIDLCAAGRAVAVKGNHEDLMLGADPGPMKEKPSVSEWRDMDDRMGWWLQNGGIQTLESYGVYDAYVNAFQGYREIDKAHLDWMRALPTFYETDTHYFVHAGVNPHKDLDLQNDNARLWIREEWLNSDKDMGKHVVHGHTPRSANPELRPNRTNLDTGAFYYGVLTAGVFLPTDVGSPSETIQVKSAK